MAAGVTAGTVEGDLAPDIKKKRKGGRCGGNEKAKIGNRSPERRKWNGGLEGG